MWQTIRVNGERVVETFWLGLIRASCMTKLHSLYTDNQITDERKINFNGIAMTSEANNIDLIPLVSLLWPVRPCYGLENPSIRMNETRFFFLACESEPPDKS